jgi:hypothetical protein
MSRPLADRLFADRLFADRGAPVRLAVALALIAAMGGYYAWWAIRAEAGWRWAMEAPQERDGAPMVFPLWVVTRVIDAEHHEISKVVRDVPLVGPVGDVAVGDTLSVQGRFDASVPAVRVEVFEHHTLRKYKEALGIFGFVVMVALAPFAFRIERRRIVERG